MIFKRKILFTISLFLVQGLIAQDGSIKASVDKNKILIGEPLQLTVEYKAAGTSIPFPAMDSIEHFEMGKPVADTVKNENGIVIKMVYKITSFDSGHWVIPSFVISPAVKTDTIPIDVVFSDFDPNQDYHDIKDILDANPSKKKSKWWWYAGGGILILFLLIYFLKRKKPPVLSLPKALVSPYEEAMTQLTQLESEKPGPKAYHSKLTDIFRLYIFRKKGILSLQKTTDDLVVQLKGLDLSKEQFDKLSQSLRLSDFVKFAKYIPTAEDDRSSLEEIKRVIITIEKTEPLSPPFGGS